MSIIAPRRPKLADLKPALARVERRLFLRQALSFGALSMLTGCDIGEDDDVEKLLWRVSRFNDKVQAALFDPNKLAPTYPKSAVTDPFPFNAYYPESDVRTVDAAAWRLELSGLIA